MSLKSRIPTESQIATKQIKIEFKSIGITIRHLPRAIQQKIADSATIMKYDDAKKTRVPSLDTEAVLKAINQHVIVEWHPTTLRTLLNVLCLEVNEGDDLDAPYTLTPEDIECLLENVADLDGFIYAAAVNPALFAPQLAHTKN